MLTARIIPKGNYAQLVVDGGVLPDKVNDRLITFFTWYDLEDLSHEEHFYEDYRMRLGVIYKVKQILEESNILCNIELPDAPYRKGLWHFAWDYRPHQREAVDSAYAMRYGIIQAPPGQGKTVMAVALICRTGLKTSVIAQAEEPFDQMYQTCKAASNIEPGRVGNGYMQVGDVTVYTIQTLARVLKENPQSEAAQHFVNSELVIVDECFPGDVKVDGKPISQIRVGDYVRAYNHATNKIELRRVTHCFKKRAHTLCRVYLQDGSYIDCTPNHPFWTGDAYTEALSLNSSHMVYSIQHQNDMPVAQPNGKRVDRVEIHEQSGDGTFGGLCSDGYVYNIEVEGLNNYFVNGILVHNCHHVSALTYLYSLDSLVNPYYIIGLSATPGDREDGRQAFINAYLGSPVYTIDFGQQIESGTACPMTVFVEYMTARKFGYAEKRDVPMWRRRLQYNEVYTKYIIENEERNNAAIAFAKEMIEDGLTVALIVSRVEHALEIHTRFPEAVVLSAKTKDRDKIIQDLKNHVVKCVVTTLFDEAVDVPSLGAVGLLAGGKSTIKLKQRLRSTRVFSGMIEGRYYKKDRGFVWFPYDRADFLKSHSSKNLSLLKALVGEHPSNELIELK